MCVRLHPGSELFPPCFLQMKGLNASLKILQHSFSLFLFDSSPFINTRSSPLLFSSLSVSRRLLCDGVIIEDVAPVFNTG